jgi:hypothetical protein
MNNFNYACKKIITQLGTKLALWMQNGSKEKYSFIRSANEKLLLNNLRECKYCSKEVNVFVKGK